MNSWCVLSQQNVQYAQMNSAIGVLLIYLDLIVIFTRIHGRIYSMGEVILILLIVCHVPGNPAVGKYIPCLVSHLDTLPDAGIPFSVYGKRCSNSTTLAYYSYHF